MLILTVNPILKYRFTGAFFSYLCLITYMRDELNIVEEPVCLTESLSLFLIIFLLDIHSDIKRTIAWDFS